MRRLLQVQFLRSVDENSANDPPRVGGIGYLPGVSYPALHTCSARCVFAVQRRPVSSRVPRCAAVSALAEVPHPRVVAPHRGRRRSTPAATEIIAGGIPAKRALPRRRDRYRHALEKIIRTWRHWIRGECAAGEDCEADGRENEASLFHLEVPLVVCANSTKSGRGIQGEKHKPQLMPRLFRRDGLPDEPEAEGGGDCAEGVGDVELLHDEARTYAPMAGPFTPFLYVRRCISPSGRCT